MNWVEKASFKKIQKLLEISKRERHHEILLTVRNLSELCRNPYPYILPVIPRPLPIEVVEGEHYVIADLLNLTLSSSFLAKSLEIEVVGRELVISTQLGQHSPAREDSGPSPQASKKVDRGSSLKSFPFTKKGYLPAPQASKKGRQVPEWIRAPSGGGRFYPLGFPNI